MGKKRLILILMAVLVLGALGIGGVMAYRMIAAASAKTEEAVEPAPPPKVTMGPVYPLDPFLVNLADVGRPRYLKVVLNLELDSANVPPELDAIRPKVRDALLTLLSSKTMAELVTVADKEKLRNEIIHRLNAFLSAGRVVEVYFVEFVVQ